MIPYIFYIAYSLGECFFKKMDNRYRNNDLVVVVVHDDTPRLQWKLAVVEELIEGKDGLVHAAHMRTATCKTTRPIVKLYPLEVSSNEGQQSTN